MTVNSKTLTIFLLVIILATFRSIFWEDLSTKALYDFDEARYAEVAKNILKTNNLFTPMAGGPDDYQPITLYTLPNGSSLHPYFWKPPLHTWILALSFSVFGINELSTRLPSLLFGVGLLVITYLISHQLFAPSRSSFASLIVVVLLASTADFSFLSSQGIAETQLLFFALLSLYLLLKPTPRLFLSALCASLAFMTKSFSTFWLFLTCFYLFYQRKFSPKMILSWLSIATILILPWHLFMFLKFKNIFIERYVLVNTIQRATGVQQNVAPVYWYLRYMFTQWWPQLLLLPLLFIAFFKHYRRLHLPILFLTIFWALSVFAPFSLAKSKVWWYIFPLWPPFLILAAYLLSFFTHRKLLAAYLLIIVLLSTVNTYQQSLLRTDYNQGFRQIG
ncbi:MAG: glycosyltransferase family 39 protein, partial [Candidatus Shapirobacteria bacterium]